MNKAILLEVLGRVKSLSPGETCALNPESAGLLRAFLQVRSKVPKLSESEKSLHTRIAQILRDWSAASAVQNVAAGDTDDRTQLALRRVIDLIRKNHWRDVRADDVLLIRATHREMIDRCNATGEEPSRLVRLMQTMLAKYDWYQGRTASDNGGEGSAPPVDSVFYEAGEESKTPPDTAAPVVRHRLIASKDFGDKKRAQKSNIDEIEYEFHGRVFEYDGETEVEGELPGDVLLVIKNGGVTLNGFVVGNVLADESITVRGNVQGGIVVSREGDISIERVLVGARVVAKRGAVRCQHVEAPKCIFAWNTITVDGPVLGGFLTSGDIQIRGKVSPGELHACGEITATSLKAGTRRGAIICLRRTLTSEDYGRSLQSEEVRQLRRMTQLEEDRQRAINMDAFTNRLIENTYRTSLFYLLGGAENAQHAMDLQGLQTKVVQLSQLVLLGESVGRYYPAAYADGATPDPFDITDFKNTSIRSLSVIRHDVESLPDEFGSVHRRYLLDRCQELEAMIVTLDEANTFQKIETFVKERLQRALTQWRGILGDTERSAKIIVEGFGIEKSVLRELDGDADALEAQLMRTLDEKLNSTDREQIQRAKSPLVRILRESAGRFSRSIQQNRRIAATAKEEIDDIRGRLEGKSIVKFGSGRKFAARVTANAFAPGVVLTATPGKLDGVHANIGETILFDELVEGPATYALGEGVIQRLTL